jgi:hypothetical protein
MQYDLVLHHAPPRAGSGFVARMIGSSTKN